jgi:hypothetical protein
MRKMPESSKRSLYFSLVIIYLAFLVTLTLWPAPGMWAVPAWLKNITGASGLILLLASPFYFKELRLFAVLAFLFSLLTLGMLLLPTL